MSKIEDQDARAAIDGAIAFGRMGVNEPPAGHWLTEYWSIGRQLAELGKTSAWDNQTPVESHPTPEQSRETRVIPRTPQEIIEFIGSNFDSMQADQWTDEVIPKPAGDLSNVRYSLTVHDLLSAFDWAGLHDAAMDRSALGREG
ncbi:hypothetical protein [Cupriavidus campinensis]